MSDELKQKIRDQVRDEIVRQVNAPKQQETEVEESFKAGMIRTGALLAAGLSFVGGVGLATLGLANGGSVGGPLAGGTGGAIAAMTAGEVIARKVADREFSNLFSKLQSAVAERDKLIEAAKAQGTQSEAEAFLAEHKREFAKLTKDQMKVAQKMRKFLGTESSSTDTARILGSLTTRDRRYLEDLIEKAESGLVTLVDV